MIILLNEGCLRKVREPKGIRSSFLAAFSKRASMEVFMKKGLAFALVALLSACFVFAEGSYVVKSVKGKVQYEVAPGKLENVKVGQTLSSSTVINTGLNSTMVLTVDGKEITIAQMKKGTVDKLTVANAGGLKTGASASSGVAGTASSKASVSTASSRASEAKEDVDWDE